MRDTVLFSLSPFLWISASFFFGEGIEDEACGHTQKADEEREVVSFSRIRRARPGEGFDHLSQGWHEKGWATHRKKIDAAITVPEMAMGKSSLAWA